VPQSRNINGSGGEWYKMEIEWAEALRSGKSVDVNIEVIYAGSSLRPECFYVTYYIDGDRTYKEILNQ